MAPSTMARMDGCHGGIQRTRFSTSSRISVVDASGATSTTTEPAIDSAAAGTTSAGTSTRYVRASNLIALVLTLSQGVCTKDNIHNDDFGEVVHVPYTCRGCFDGGDGCIQEQCTLGHNLLAIRCDRFVSMARSRRAQKDTEDARIG